MPLLLPPVLPILCSKRSWSLTFDEDTLAPSLIFIEDNGVGSSSSAPSLPLVDLVVVQVPQEVIFSSPKLFAVAKPRKKSGYTPLVETSFRCCTCSTAKRDGFRAGSFVQIPMSPK